MNIKEIYDKIILKGGVREDHYTTANGIDDINQEYMLLVETIAQKEPATKAVMTGGTYHHEFSIASAVDTVIARTVIDCEVELLEYRYNDNEEWKPITKETKAGFARFCSGTMRFDFDEKEIRVENPYIADYRATYAKPALTLFTVADLTADPVPSPTLIPKVYRPLLWLTPAIEQAEKFKPSHVPGLERQHERLMRSFTNHYRRTNDSVVMTLVSEESRNCPEEVTEHFPV